MTDAHIRRRVSTCLIMLVVGSALSAAQPRKPEEVDQAVRQQQSEIEQLKSSVKDLNTKLDDNNRKSAPPAAWWVLGTVGLIFVLTWGVIAFVRETTRFKEAEIASVEKMRVEINQQVQQIESAATGRIEALTELLREAHRLPSAATSNGGAWLEFVREVFGRSPRRPS